MESNATASHIVLLGNCTFSNANNKINKPTNPVATAAFCLLDIATKSAGAIDKFFTLFFITQLIWQHY